MRVWNVALKANKILEKGDVGGGAVKLLISSFRGIRVISSLDALRRPCDFPLNNHSKASKTKTAL